LFAHAYISVGEPQRDPVLVGVLLIVRRECPCRGGENVSPKARSNKGHACPDVQYSCVVVGCHLRRKVFEFAVSHDPHNPKVAGSNPPPATKIYKELPRTHTHPNLYGVTWIPHLGMFGR
jgi:hypothetical protein